METHMRTLMLVVGLLVSLPLAAPMVVASSAHAQTQTSPGGLIPASVRTTDLAPQIPAADKSTAIVRHPDGSYETYLVPEDQLDAFIKNLGNDVLVTLIPPQSLIGHVPPQAPPPVGIVQYPVTGPQPTPPPPPQPRQRAAKTSRCGRSQGLRADANQRVAKRSSVVSHGVRLTLNMPRSTYPRDALVRMAVDLRNV
ncbi:MAG: hypothetical protein ACR2GA_01585, partial [Chloroflexota bacterium]